MDRTLLRAVPAALLALGLASTPAGATAFLGTYLGADVGYGWGEANSENFGAIGGALTSVQADADLDGFLIGAHFGHNWSIGGNWILGVEGDWRYSGLEGDDGGSGGDINELSANFDASLRARVGEMVAPDMMLYVTGGLTWLDADSNVNNAPTETLSKTFSGWTLGGGLECGMGPSMTLRVEYRYSDYDEQRLTFPINGYDMATGPATNELTAGVSWYF